MEKRNIPKLRFPGFDGEWEVTKLGQTAEFYSGGTPSTSRREYYDGEIPFIKSGEIKTDKTDQFLSNLGLKNSSARLVKTGDILYALYGATSGEVAVSKISGAINQAVLCIKSAHNHLYIAEYLGYQKENIVKTYLQGGQGNLSAEIVKSFKVPFPSLPEQQKIAAFLTSVDQKIVHLKNQKRQLESYKNAMMQQLFSRQLRFRQDDGSDFPEWGKKCIQEILTIGSGRDYKHLGGGEVPVFGTGGYMTSVDSYLYDGETVCIGRKGTIDNPMYFSGKIWTVDTLFYTHSFQGVLPKYIYFVFNQINWKEYNEASGVPSLSKKTIERIQIETPSLPEQTKIANFLSAIDKRIALSAAQLEKTDRWKRGLLQQLFV